MERQAGAAAVSCAAGIACSWFAVEMKKAREQKEAVAAVVKGGGVYEYDWRFDANGHHLPLAQPICPAWVRSLLGDDFFGEVVYAIYLRNPEDQVTNLDLSPLSALTHLQLLWLNAPQVTDAELEHLRGLSQLKVLNLATSTVSDSGLKQLVGLTQLEALNLDQSSVTDHGLKYISNLTELRDLSLRYTQITDAGLQKLGNLRLLRALKLDGTDVTDAGLKSLTTLTDLATLWLPCPEVTEAGVKELEKALPKCKIMGWKTVEGNPPEPAIMGSPYF